MQTPDVHAASPGSGDQPEPELDPLEMPRIREQIAVKHYSRRVTYRTNDDLHLCYVAAFYPYSLQGGEHIFAFTSVQRRTWVCAVDPDRAVGLRVLKCFKDEEPREELYALCWSKELESGTPLLCVAGQKSKVKVLNALTGELRKTFVGHGAPIQSLKTHPRSPRIIASCSEDHAIRLWDTNVEDERFGCVLICAGGAHRAGVLDIAFHDSGRFLLSGGFDHQVNLWALPKLPDPEAIPDKVPIVHHPHFSSTEVHSNYVDCLAFYGNLIVSRARNENRIQIWRIHGFDTLAVNSKASPQNAAAPVPGHAETRSAFGNGFTILLNLDCPNTHEWFLRFGIFQHAQQRPTVAIGNIMGEIFFWDLQDIEEGRLNDEPDGNGGYVLGGPFYKVLVQTCIVPSRSAEEDVNWLNIAWSTDGRWCVAVAAGSMAIMERKYPPR